MIKKFTVIFLVLSLAMLFGKIPTEFDSGSPKTWSYDKIQNYYIYKKSLEMQNEHPMRRTAIMSGNMIRTLVFDFGSIGAPGREPSLEWPIYSNHGYAYEFGPLVGVEVPIDTNGIYLPYINNGEDIDNTNPAYDTTFHIICDGLLDGGAGGDAEEVDENNEPWGWEPIEGYANPNSTSVPLSHKPETWNPAWESWPGTYKANAATADQAIYFVMDDRFNTEFPVHAFPATDSTGGLGLRVKVRAYQWSNPLANDAIFFVYEITNTSKNDYEKVVFGMFGDPHIGGSNDFSDDMAWFDKEINMVYGYDGDNKGEWGGETGWLGYMFLESPGNPYDGIDNDGDGMIDESMTDGIDNDGDWDISKHDVGIDGIGPEDPNYPGPDEGEGDGVPTAGDRFDPTKPGEPNFEFTDLDESDQIGLTSFNAFQYGADKVRLDENMWRRLKPSTLIGVDNAFTDIAQRSDNVFIYGSGYFPLKAGDTQRFSVGLLMGENEYDLFKTSEVVQNIYNSGYRFAKAPDKPLVTAVASDEKVTLYWDDKAESSWDPIYGNDFQGYAVYRSTDPGFNEVHTITDNNGVATLWQPIAKFDLNDGIKGESYHGINGLHYDLGRDTGLKHEFTDTDVKNGVTYYYAVCSYDIGDTTGTMAIPPTECTKIIDVDAYTGETTYDLNTTVAIPHTSSPGTIVPEEFEDSDITHVGPGSGSIDIKIMNNEYIRDNISYQVTFGDAVSGASDTVMFVTEMTTYQDTITPADSSYQKLTRTHVVDVNVYDSNNNIVSDSKYYLNSILGKMKFNESLWDNEFIVKYKYQPVWQNRYFNNEDAATIFDGLRLFTKDDTVGINESETGWLTGESNISTQITRFNYTDGSTGERIYIPYAPNIYQFEWDTTYMDTATWVGNYAPFKIKDVTYAYKDSTFYVPFVLNGGNEFKYSVSQVIVLTDSIPDPQYAACLVKFNNPPSTDPILPEFGNIYQIKINRPFGEQDTFSFSTESAKYDEESFENPLDEIAVVPNPYCAQAIWETKSGFATGRGARRVDFINLPPQCTIRIFTIAGDLVKKIEHNASFWNSNESYNLLNEDNMDIAFGVYLWHVDASASNLGTKTGKFAVIK